MSTGVGYQQCNPGLKNRISSGGSGSGGGSFIINPVYSTVTLSQSTDTVNIGIPGFNIDFDTLIVFKNSIYMAPEQFYSVVDSSTIKATNGYGWKAGTVFNFIALCIDKAPDVLKTISKRNKVVITKNSSYVDIGIPDIRPDADTIFIFKNGIYQEKDVDYTTDGSKIYPKGDSVFKADSNNPSLFNFLVLQEVFDGSILTSFDGDNIIDNSIPVSKLAEDVRNQIRAIGDLNKLNTTNKDTLVNAINEVNTKANGIKTTIGTATLNTSNKTIKESINELKTSLDTTSNKVNGFADDISSAKSKANTNAGNISTINSTIGSAALKTSDKTLKGAINEVKSTIDTISSKASSNASEIASVKSIADSNASNISNLNSTIGSAALTTSDKTLKGAINEVFQCANNAKSNLASVIGYPISASNTFDDMKNSIQNSKNTLASLLNSKGVGASSNDTLNNIINLVGNISLQSMGGILMAQGNDSVTIQTLHTGYGAGYDVKFLILDLRGKISFYPKIVLCAFNLPNLGFFYSVMFNVFGSELILKKRIAQTSNYYEDYYLRDIKQYNYEPYTSFNMQYCNICDYYISKATSVDSITWVAMG